MKKSGTLIIGCVIAIVAVYYTVRNVSFTELAESFRHVRYPFLFPSVLLVALSFVARAVRWRVLIAPLKNVRTIELYSPLMVGFMANALPARAGEVIRAFLLGKKHDLRFVSCFATILVERLFDLFLLLLLFGWILLFRAEIFDSGITWSGLTLEDLAFRFGLVSMVLAVVLVVFIFLLVHQKEKALRLTRWVIRPLPQSWQNKILHLIDTFSAGLEIVRDWKSLLKASWTTVLVWACIVFSYYPLYWAYDLQDKSITSLVLLVVMICILISVLPTPAFIGSLNAGVFIALHEIMQESEVVAVSFGLVTWTLNFGVIVAGGLYFLLHDHISVRQLAQIEEEA